MIDGFCFTDRVVEQNRGQKVFSRRALRSCRGAWHWKFDKTCTAL